jgi:hypothetical protein
MPEPIQAYKLSVRDGKLYNFGQRYRINGLGLYFIWERKLGDPVLHQIFRFLSQHGINMIRVFALSRFLEVEIRAAKLYEWQFYRRIEGGYDIWGKKNQEWLNYIQRFCSLAGKYKIAVQIVFGEHCGFKQYNTNNYGWNRHPWNKKNAIGGDGFHYDGNQFFEWARNTPRLNNLWQILIQEVVNACGRVGNCIWELTNEAPASSDSEVSNWLLRAETWITSQLERLSLNVKPVFADSSDQRTFPHDHIYWEHIGFKHPQQGGMISTDGKRYNQFSEHDIKNMSIHYKNHDIDLETHMAFLSKKPDINGNPEDIGAYLWFGRSATIEDWQTHIGPYLNMIK